MRAGRVAELVGQGEHERDVRRLVVRIDLKDVEADALGLVGLVEEPVALRLRQRRFDRLIRESFQLAHARPPELV